VAISRSSQSSEPPAWLRAVYERRRRRTVRLVELSIAALKRAGKPSSLAAIAGISQTVDPAEPDGVSASGILHNEEAYALYRQHAEPKRRPPRRTPSNARTDVSDDTRVRVKPDRDQGRARQRYLRSSKIDLVDRLLAAELAYADMESRWLKTADELLAWILVIDRVLAGNDSSGRKGILPP
jgi:hypothetical protein